MISTESSQYHICMLIIFQFWLSVLRSTVVEVECCFVDVIPRELHDHAHCGFPFTTGYTKSQPISARNQRDWILGSKQVLMVCLEKWQRYGRLHHCLILFERIQSQGFVGAFLFRKKDQKGFALVPPRAFFQFPDRSSRRWYCRSLLVVSGID